MLDFDKNDYHVKETGRDFWGNRKYEIIEKPKGGGCAGIIIVFLFLFYLAKGCNGNSSANTDEVNQSTPDTKEERNDSEHQNDNQNGPPPKDDKTNPPNTTNTEGIKKGPNQIPKIKESETIVLIEDPIERDQDQDEEEKTEIENDQISDKKVSELFDKYSNSETNAKEKDIIKMISKELKISKLKVKKVLKKSGKL